MGSAGEVHRLIICKLGLKYYLNEELHAWKNASSYIFNIVDSNDIGFMETGGGGMSCVVTPSCRQQVELIGIL